MKPQNSSTAVWKTAAVVMAVAVAVSLVGGALAAAARKPDHVCETRISTRG